MRDWLAKHGMLAGLTVANIVLWIIYGSVVSAFVVGWCSHYLLTTLKK